MKHTFAKPPLATGLAVLLTGLMTLTACASDGEAEPVRTYSLRLRAEDSQDDYSYVAVDPVDLRVGDEVTFEFDNTGSLPHDLQVVDPDGAEIALSPVAAAGAATSVTVLFEAPGFYRLNCLVDDHLTEHGMQAIVEVTEV